MGTRVIFIILAAAGAASALIYLVARRFREKRGRLLEEIKMMCGGEPRLLTRCVVVRGASRVPGIIALSSDRIIFRSLIMNFQGEIPIDSIERAEVKKTLTYKYARKKFIAGMRGLEVAAPCDVYYFFIRKADVPAWREALSIESAHPG